MKKIEKKDIVDLLSKKANINFSEEKILNEIVDELYDEKIQAVFPLDYIETYVFRKRYGIINQGIIEPVESICEETNLSFSKINKLLNSVIVKLLFRIKKIGNYERKKKISSFDLANESLPNFYISTLPLSVSCKNKLLRSYFFTIHDILECSLKELKLILGKKELQELISYIPSLKLRFLDELSIDEKKEIILNSSISYIPLSSPYWITGIEHLSSSILNDYGIEDIKSLVSNVFRLPKKDQLEVLKSIVELNLYDILKNEESKKL